jgi:hypothetical protein
MSKNVISVKDMDTGEQGEYEIPDAIRFIASGYVK